MARVLVIGGNLFIGRALVEELLERGDEVVIMHRGSGTPFGRRVGEIRCDRNNVAAVRKALSGTRFDVVYDNVYDWERGTTAEQVSAAAIAASDGLSRYVFTSSIAAYPPGGEYDERDPLVPADFPNPYAAQKAASERALFELHRQRGIPVTTLRPTFIYGPHNPFDREAFFWDRMLAGRPIIIPEDGLAHDAVGARAGCGARRGARRNKGRRGRPRVQPRELPAHHPDRVRRIAGEDRAAATRSSFTSHASKSSRRAVSCSRHRSTSVCTSTSRPSRPA